MNSATIILVGGLGAAISWGISDYLAARSAKKVGPTLASAVVNIIGALAYILIYFAFFRDNVLTDISGIAYSAAAGVILALGSFALFRGLEKGPVSIVSPLTSLYPLATTILAIVAFNTRLSLQQSLGILLIIIGVIAASGLLNVQKSERKIATGPKYGLLAAFLWGIGYSLLAQGIAKLGWHTATMIEFTSVAITFVAVTPFLKGNEKINIETVKTAMRNKYVLGAALIQLVGVLALNYGLSRENSSGAIVTALSATYPLLTVFLAIKHMKEKVFVLPLIGAFVGIVGVIVVTLG